MRDADSAPLKSAIAGFAVPISMYVLADGFVDAVQQYPFEYYGYLSSGAESIQAFLLSPDGHSPVRDTSLGLVPIVVVWALILGAVMGYLGGRIGRRWNRNASARVCGQPAAGEERSGQFNGPIQAATPTNATFSPELPLS